MNSPFYILNFSPWESLLGVRLVVCLLENRHRLDHLAVLLFPFIFYVFYRVAGLQTPGTRDPTPYSRLQTADQNPESASLSPLGWWSQEDAMGNEMKRRRKRDANADVRSRRNWIFNTKSPECGKLPLISNILLKIGNKSPRDRRVNPV